MMQLIIKTTSKRQVLDITRQVERQLDDNGIVHAFVQHTTAALTTADLDPGTDQDLLDALQGMTPQIQWQHPHNPNHFPDHLWASVIGPDVSLPFRGGKLQLGAWQRLVLIEFDGPRERQLELMVN
jgi:secondary thiamine-phosphate synthase enzyme